MIVCKDLMFAFTAVHTRFRTHHIEESNFSSLSRLSVLSRLIIIIIILHLLCSQPFSCYVSPKTSNEIPLKFCLNFYAVHTKFRVFGCLDRLDNSLKLVQSPLRAACKTFCLIVLLVGQYCPPSY